MRILKINLDNPEKAIIDKTVEALKNGEVIIYPTDTVYGLGVNAFDENAVKKIFEIKGRNFNKPISVIVKDIEMAKKIAEFDEKSEKIFNKLLPGPITLILFKKEISPDILTANTDKIGIRIPDCKFTQILMENLDFPITTTSANISDEQYSGDVENMLSRFKQGGAEPDLVLDAGFLPESEASTVVDLTGLKPVILREGAVKKEKLLNL